MRSFMQSKVKQINGLLSTRVTSIFIPQKSHKYFAVHADNIPSEYDFYESHEKRKVTNNVI
jgi:hypothetical protein